MTISLYKPTEEPLLLTPTQFSADIHCNGQLPVDRVAELLGCAKLLVDVLASGPDYVMYSVFDCEGEINPIAMEVFEALTGEPCEDDPLRGPILCLCL
ncbi:hypothetical protein AUC43_15390 [Hymenobacter sedentarius]|uniref:Uncharacterized protein n=1 Tax=Hymenobacter sedentarius TaxID=1411621 RepID=A0A0U4BIG5_9BACT|nr:hypothetical protein [Hymenobacter sedentarius]ALW86347.1 hypothetical protein AUC43_15390 [Hymenobacter sedentarius]